MGCINGKCSDPCGQHDVCGVSATCSVINQEASCSCPQCFEGLPNVECKRNDTCVPFEPKNEDFTICISNDDCQDHLSCDKETKKCLQLCNDNTCEPNKRCEVRRHQLNCICKFGFILNSNGEFVCAGNNIECHRHEDCSSDLGCINNQCKSPCAQGNLCPTGKTCVVMNHQAVCLCLEDCTPSVEICLRDEGCPENLACVSYQCTDPCNGHICAGDSPCYVEEHKPLCKFCPTGFTIDPVYGCVKGKQINEKVNIYLHKIISFLIQHPLTILTFNLP